MHSNTTLAVALFAAAAMGLAAPARAELAVSFHTPSDNIHCSFYAEESGMKGVSCEIRDRDSNEPVLRRPADCDLEWGDSFYLPAEGRPSLGCHGDTIRDPNGFVLSYGATHEFEFRGLSCTSEKSGLTCRNGQGHGFSLSRAKQELF